MHAQKFIENLNKSANSQSLLKEWGGDIETTAYKYSLYITYYRLSIFNLWTWNLKCSQMKETFEHWDNIVSRKVYTDFMGTELKSRWTKIML